MKDSLAQINGNRANDIVFDKIFLPLFSKREKCCRTTVIFSVPEHVVMKYIVKVISQLLMWDVFKDLGNR